MSVNATHNPELRSWVESANDPATDFPMQNLPLGAMVQWDQQHGHHHTVPCIGIGDSLLNLGSVAALGFLRSWSRNEEFERAIRQSLHGALAIEAWHALMPELRVRLQDFLRHDAPAGSMVRRQREQCLHARDKTQIVRPFMIENYTDFYASKHHAMNVGAMFRPDNPLLPNYAHVPIGYHGRASSIGSTGMPIRRPRGQMSPSEEGGAPGFGPSTMLDYEAEMGVFIARGNKLGEPIAIGDARSHVFGMCIVNDWSARDIQKWEYQPLGPFLAKNFATTISPLVVTMEALAPFRAPGPSRADGDPTPLSYLQAGGATDGGLDITIDVSIQTEQMREKGMPAHRVSRGNVKDLYWTIDQLVTHHTVGGCNLRAGDLLATGTVSGPTADSRGCLLELTWDGVDPGTKKPRPRKAIQLPTGESRMFLADGDEVVMTAFCERDGFRRIGFGECRGRVTGAPTGAKTDGAA